MSLIVKVYINDKEIIRESARRIDAFKGEGYVHRYVNNKTGKIFTHTYSDGAAKLARMLLESITE